MIAQVKGLLIEKTPTRVVLDVHGIGYQINIPVSTYEKLPDLGCEALLLTHLHVREDVMQLFGFRTEKDRRLFQLLISVSGIGPKMALGVLSGISVEEFTGAVANNNFSVLTRIPGVGKKTAQRLVVEMKDKLGAGIETMEIPANVAADVVEEAVLALISLGYRQNEAQKVVAKVARSQSKLPSVEVLIKKALQSAVTKS